MKNTTENGTELAVSKDPKKQDSPIKGTMGISIESDTLMQARVDFDTMLQKLIKEMSEKNADEGSITMKISITMPEQTIPNSHGMKEYRSIRVPQFTHAITNGIVLKDSTKGKSNPDMELYWDDDSKTYRLRYVSNTAQMSIFDAEFQDTDGSEGHGKVVIDGSGIIVNESIQKADLSSADRSEDEDPEDSDTEEKNVEGDALSEAATDTSTDSEPENRSEDVPGSGADESAPGDDAFGFFGEPVEDDDPDEDSYE